MSDSKETANVIAVTFCYERDVALDDEYYFGRHLPLAESLMQPLGIRRIEVRRAIGGSGGAPAPHRILASLYFDSLAAYQAAMRLPSYQQAVADVANYYAGTPSIQISEVTWERSQRL